MRYAWPVCLAILVLQTSRIGSADSFSRLAHSQPVELYVE